MYSFVGCQKDAEVQSKCFCSLILINSLFRPGRKSGSESYGLLSQYIKLYLKT